MELDNRDNRIMSGEPLAVRITYFFWGAIDLDVDNIAKPILDALKSIVYNDDRQVEELLLVHRDLSVRLIQASF